MSELKGKIDFTLFVSADNANPNGDPLNGNRPRYKSISIMQATEFY